MKKAKSNALLMELACVTLCFALSAVVLVEVFALAGSMSRKAERLERVLKTTQNVAERLYVGMQTPETLEKDGFSYDGSVWMRMEKDYRITVTLTDEVFESGLLRHACVQASDEEEELLTLTDARYIPKGGNEP